VGRALAAALFLVLAVADLGGASPKPAKPKPPPTPISRQIQALQDQVAEVSADEADLLDKLDASNGRLNDLNGKVADIDRRMAPVQAALAGAQGRLDEFAGKVVAAENRLSEAQGQLADARDRLTAHALAAYAGQSALARYAELLLHVRTVRELAAGTTYVRALFEDEQATVDRYDTLRHQVSELRDSLEQDRAKALAQRDVVGAQERELANSRQAQDAVRQQAAVEVAQQNGLLSQLRARKSEFQSQIAALQRQSDALAATLRSRQSGQGLVPSGHGVLAVPIPGAPITSGFGPRTHPIYGDVRMHTGIDFGASYGTPIRAAGDGVVVSAGPLGGYGNATVIDHGNGLATLYAHQSDMSVSPGQRVSRGQVIGYVGSTGFSTGPHLHFEVRVRGTPVDPMQYL
jgi:murein DD-endopeptidase MepM/ murein hydrolase activator NlpD